MRSWQVNAFRVNTTCIAAAALVDVQALSICRASIRISLWAFTFESALCVNTFSPVCTGIIRAFVDVWRWGGSWLIIQFRSGGRGEYPMINGLTF